MKTACVEAGELGGVCNNAGCIPTKALLESAMLARRMKGLAQFGIKVGKVELDLGAAAKRGKRVADQGAKGVAFLFKKNGVELIKGRARLAGDGKVLVRNGDAEQTLKAKHIIVATGSRPQELPMLKADGDRVWNSNHAVFPASAPASLAIIGAGAIGMEFADVFASFGTKVTVIEALPRILPLEDEDVSEVVAKVFGKRGIELLPGARVEKAEIEKDRVRLEVKTADDETKAVEAERVLIAVGRAPLVEDLGLEEAGVKLENAFIAVDRRLATSAPGVYAIGDVAGPPLLAHKASHEGIAVVEAIAGDEHAGLDYDNIPNVTYCSPEVASVGLTEAAAREKGLDIQVGTFPFSANGRARTAGSVDGFVKVIRDVRYDEILGAHMVGPHVSEMIGEIVLARCLESTVEELERAIHPHPTLSESLAEAALAALGRAIHM